MKLYKTKIITSESNFIQKLYIDLGFKITYQVLPLNWSQEINDKENLYLIEKRELKDIKDVNIVLHQICIENRFYTLLEDKSYKPDYTYFGEVEKVIDGDTVIIKLDLGFNTFYHPRCRLARINAPELKKEAELAKAAKQALHNLLASKEIKVISNRLDSYGRSIAELFVDNINVNDRLVELGYAEYKKYK